MRAQRLGMVAALLSFAGAGVVRAAEESGPREDKEAAGGLARPK